MAARGVIKRFYSRDNSEDYTADSTTDMVLSNVPVVAGRLYKVELHSQWSLPDQGIGVNDQSWNILLHLNGVTIDRFGRIANQTDVVGTDEGVGGTIHQRLYWAPVATQATDDLAVFADSVGSNPMLTFQATPRAKRTLTLVDVGLA